MNSCPNCDSDLIKIFNENGKKWILCYLCGQSSKLD